MADADDSAAPIDDWAALPGDGPSDDASAKSPAEQTNDDVTAIDDLALEGTTNVEAGSAPVDEAVTSDGFEADWGAGDAAAGTTSAPTAMGATPTTAPRYAGTRSGDTQLGPEGIDEHGHRGRIHTVVPGDTLWDISAAYLGTPWIWPSVWQDNGEIENPHLILPGDHIWVTAGEMRKITREQAADMMAADNQDDFPAELEDEVDTTSAWEPIEEDEGDLMADDAPAAMEQLPVAVPLQPTPSTETGRTVRVVEREAMGFVSTEAVEAATSILDSTSPRTLLVEGDMIYLGMGEGAVEIGDEFTIYHDAEQVRDVESGRLLGYHVDILGWAVVREIDGESAIAEIRMSNADAERGDHLIPRAAISPVVPIKVTPDGIAGQIVFMPNSRTEMGSGDYVYLNRGALHGYEVGSAVEVFTPGRLKQERVTGTQVMTPDRVDARMVLVEVKPETSVAFIVHTKRELEIGDRVRAVNAEVASR